VILQFLVAFRRFISGRELDLTPFWEAFQLTKDLIPFGLAIGNRAVLEGLNLTGLRRRNFDSSEIKKVKEAYSILFESSETEFKKRVILLKDSKIQSTVVNDIIDFVSQKGNRSYCLPES